MSGGKGRTRPALAAALLAAALVALAAAGLARGERAQRGNLIVSLDGHISPRRLPRHTPAPASVVLSGQVSTADRSPLPRLRRVELDIAAPGGIDTRGLPVCPRRRLLSATVAEALAACGSSLVGHGRLGVDFFLPGQAPFAFAASLRAFNGRFADGSPAVWLHVYGSSPPSAFVLGFARRHGAGDFPTRLIATLPANLGPWPHLARFKMTFGRRFAYRGTRHSFLSANCPLPPRFTAGIFPFARATYAFDGGSTVSTAIARGCRVRGR